MPTTTFKHRHDIGDIVWAFETGLEHNGLIKVKVISIKFEKTNHFFSTSYLCRMLNCNKKINCFESQMFIEKEECISELERLKEWRN